MRDISLNFFKSLFPAAPNIGLGEDFHIMDFTLPDASRIVDKPCRFDCFMLVYCVSGNIKFNVNQEEHALKNNMLFLNFPGNLLRVNRLIGDKKQDIHYICISMSRDYVSTLLLDINKLLAKNMFLSQTPCLCLEDNERNMLCNHVELIIRLLKSGVSYGNESVKSLMSSLLYYIVGLWSSRQAEKGAVAQDVTSRNRTLFEKFIKLVMENFSKYRNVGFYAERLNITPKYLSRLIKEVSGRSAPDWIDSYVILEAKNLLKYSDMAIKEIVFKLNFPNQSVFYKFFKVRTGMTLSEYRNS